MFHMQIIRFLPVYFSSDVSWYAFTVLTVNHLNMLMIIFLTTFQDVSEIYRDVHIYDPLLRFTQTKKGTSGVPFTLPISTVLKPGSSSLPGPATARGD
jgi:hypothetical protein